MALDLGHDVLARHGRPVDPSAQRVDNVAEGFVAGDGVVGVLDPELDRAGDLALVSGEGGSVDGDLGWFRHCDKRYVGSQRVSIGFSMVGEEMGCLVGRWTLAEKLLLLLWCPLEWV